MNRVISALAALVLALCASSSEAAWTCSVHTSKGRASGGSTSTLTTDAVDTSGTDWIGVGAVWYSGAGAALSTFSDTKLNTWDHKTAKASGGGTGVSTVLYYTTSTTPTVGPGHTVTITFGGDAYPSVFLLACSGVKATSPYDTESAGGATSGATTLAAGSLTTAEDCELLISAGALVDGDLTSIDSSFTISDSIADNANSVGGALAYRTNTVGSTSYNPTWTNSLSSEMSAIHNAWKAATASGCSGGGSTLRNLTLTGVGD